MNPIHLVVTEQHRSEYPEPITFDKGASLSIGEKYSDEEGWELLKNIRISENEIKSLTDMSNNEL